MNIFIGAIAGPMRCNSFVSEIDGESGGKSLFLEDQWIKERNYGGKPIVIQSAKNTRDGAYLRKARMKPGRPELIPAIVARNGAHEIVLIARQERATLVLIEEGHFWEEGSLIKACIELKESWGVSVWVSGIDLDHWCHPFHWWTNIQSVADKIIMLTGECYCLTAPSTKTFRYIMTDERTAVDTGDCYEPFCDACMQDAMEFRRKRQERRDRAMLCNAKNTKVV